MLEPARSTFSCGLWFHLPMIGLNCGLAHLLQPPGPVSQRMSIVLLGQKDVLGENYKGNSLTVLSGSPRLKFGYPQTHHKISGSDSRQI